MSSSLFYDCYAPYESYPSTFKNDGDKTFGELKEGDVLYLLHYSMDKGEEEYTYKIVPLTVTKPWHESKGHCYITCVEDKNKKHYINFGPSNCWNVYEESKNSSIVCYKTERSWRSEYVGTNKDNVIKCERQWYESEIEKLNRQIADKQKKIDKLNMVRI